MIHTDSRSAPAGLKPRRRLCGLVLAALTVMVGIAVLATTDALALPEGRHYEMVSPLYKGGYGVNFLEGAAVEGAAEGDRVVFSSLGSFAGASNNLVLTSYLARRGSADWSTEALTAPASIVPYGGLADLSPTLESSLFGGIVGPNGGVAAHESTEAEFLLHGLGSPGMGFPVAGIPLKQVNGKRFGEVATAGMSQNGCHILFYSGEALLSDALPPTGAPNHLYDLASGAPGCGSEPALRLVAVRNEPGIREPRQLDPYCIGFLGASDNEGTQFGAISADGEEVFFEANANLTDPTCDGELRQPGDPAILYVRLNGDRTVQVSRPIAADCQSGPCTTSEHERRRAMFFAANEAGSRVFFTTTQPLVTGDTDAAKDVYMAEIGCPAAKPGCAVVEREVTSLVQVSHDPNAGEAAEVQGVSVASPDGGRVYFVARGVLSREGPGTAGAQSLPVKGADNLYVYDAQEATTRFIADLCSGPQQSGAVQDLRCPATLGTQAEEDERASWGAGFGGHKLLQTTGNGEFLLFSSSAQLVAGDTDTAMDVYRYDAQTGSLDRVSVGEAGYDANGNNNDFGAQIPGLDQGGRLAADHEMGYRAIGEDGSRVVFETAGPLSPRAVNGLVNAYEWHKEPGWSEGRVSLVSNGSDIEPVGVGPNGDSHNIVITPLGRDIFFATVQGLLPRDIDGARDIYDARLGEDFASGGAPVQPCSGDACQGPLTNPAPLLVPGSVSQAAGENIASVVKATPKKKSNKKVRPKRRRRGGRASRARHSARRASVGRGRR